MQHCDPVELLAFPGSTMTTSNTTIYYRFALCSFERFNVQPDLYKPESQISLPVSQHFKLDRSNMVMSVILQ